MLAYVPQGCQVKHRDEGREPAQGLGLASFDRERLSLGVQELPPRLVPARLLAVLTGEPNLDEPAILRAELHHVRQLLDQLFLPDIGGVLLEASHDDDGLAGGRVILRAAQSEIILLGSRPLPCRGPSQAHAQRIQNGGLAAIVLADQDRSFVELDRDIRQAPEVLNRETGQSHCASPARKCRSTPGCALWCGRSRALSRRRGG